MADSPKPAPDDKYIIRMAPALRRKRLGELYAARDTETPGHFFNAEGATKDVLAHAFAEKGGMQGFIAGMFEMCVRALGARYMEAEMMEGKVKPVKGSSSDHYAFTWDNDLCDKATYEVVAGPFNVTVHNSGIFEFELSITCDRGTLLGKEMETSITFKPKKK